MFDIEKERKKNSAHLFQPGDWFFIVKFSIHFLKKQTERGEKERKFSIYNPIQNRKLLLKKKQK